MMRTVRLEGVRLAGICARVPAKAVDTLARCTELYGDPVRAAAVVETTGIRSRRVLDPGVTALDLCVGAARDLISGLRTEAGEIGAVLFVSFTSDLQMPGNACRAQARLGLGPDVIALDIGLACSGWPYGVYVAGLLARSTGRKVLLLDGDAQTPRLDPDDAATVALLSDAGSATLVEPAEGRRPFEFAFLTDGGKGDALRLPCGGRISMDGFAVFRFVATDVLRFIRAFLSAIGAQAGAFDAFVPHQANMFLIERLAAKLGFGPDRLKKSGDALGNASSASVPVTIARAQARGRLLVAGFGGGLSAAVADLHVDGACRLDFADFSGSAPTSDRDLI